MPRIFELFLALCALAAAQCPNNGLAAHERCWYMSEAGKSCAATCAANGIEYSWFTADPENPMVPQLLGRNPSTKQFSWARTECYVPQADRFHTAKHAADSNAADNADPGDWSLDVCRLACPCKGSAAAALPAIDNAGPYPGCIASNIVLRHNGAHAIFVDLSTYGSAGCWQNDCKNSDKFNADDYGVCARTCSQLDDCTHWTFGEQEGAKRCFFRKSDGGRETAEGWFAATKACSPPAILSSTIAREASAALRVCDAGKSDACPDMARAITTWKFAIRHLKDATDGKVDANTMQYLNQIASDTEAFASQMSEENFPVIVGNNRQVFNVLEPWLASQPTSPVDTNDNSLPNPLLGKLCGPNSCYERV
mmetsp:Transcript_65598/g.182416  ORF Transcript_65598/g.182416 Transcript_65598/m.182416 type:complete len:367 (-) Transcript_65598:130-1230(-)